MAAIRVGVRDRSALHFCEGEGGGDGGGGEGGGLGGGGEGGGDTN